MLHPDPPPRAGARGVNADAVTEWTSALGGDLRADDDRARLELIGALERLKCAAAAAQATLAAQVDASQRSEQARMGMPPSDRAAASPPRSRWRAGSHPTAAGSTSVWRRSCMRRRRAPWPPSAVERSPSGRPRSWRGRPLASISLIARRSTRSWAPMSTDLRRWGREARGRGSEAGLPAPPQGVRRTARPRRGPAPGHPAPPTRRDEPALRAPPGGAGRGAVRRSDPGGRQPPGARRPSEPRPDHGRHSRPAGDRPDDRDGGARRRQRGDLRRRAGGRRRAAGSLSTATAGPGRAHPRAGDQPRVSAELRRLYARPESGARSRWSRRAASSEGRWR